jgi:hypothetical protein
MGCRVLTIRDHRKTARVIPSDNSLGRFQKRQGELILTNRNDLQLFAPSWVSGNVRDEMRIHRIKESFEGIEANSPRRF